MVGLAQDADRSADRMDRFHEQLARYRTRLREVAFGNSAMTQAEADRQGIEMERELDNLLMQAANLAREPLLRHMGLAMQHAVSLAPSPLMVYPTKGPTS